MNILCIGDVIGQGGLDFLRKHLRELKKLKNIDLTIANGENTAESNGITPNTADDLFASGVDCITTGNHCFKRRESYDMFESDLPVIRPANYPSRAIGRGYDILDLGRAQVAVVNLMGVVSMSENLESPFTTMDKVLSEIHTKFIVVDFHAEATAEKRALAEYLDGRVSAIFGTHTHVQTADEQILRSGTGFITDVGMCGAYDSIIGADTEIVLGRMLSHMPARFAHAQGPCMLNAVVFTVDNSTGKTTAVERINIR